MRLQMTPLYDDVVQLMARSGVSYNTTLMIEGGGQDYFIVERKPNGDTKLNRFAPRFIVDMKTRKRDWREFGDGQFPAFAASARKVMLAGGIVGMGSHGEIPGLGFHWEMEAHVMGGWTPAEVLRAATLGSAGRSGGKPTSGASRAARSPISSCLIAIRIADIRNTLSISLVMQGGRLYDASTLDELWPRSTALLAALVSGRRTAGHARIPAEAFLRTIEGNGPMKSLDADRIVRRRARRVIVRMGTGSGPQAPRTMIEIYRIAPGAARGLPQGDRAGTTRRTVSAGLPPRQLYVHSDGADWDFILIQPDEYPPDKQAALDKAWKQLGLPTGADFFLNFRRFVADHSDTVAIGPTSRRQEYLATRTSK